MEKEIARELAIKYNRKEKEIKLMLEICRKIDYNINIDYVEIIENFFENKNCY